MGYLRDLELIFGQMTANMKEISSRGSEMDTGYGILEMDENNTKDNMYLIKNAATENTLGPAKIIYTRVTLKMMSGMDMGNCSSEVSLNIKDSGSMERQKQI